MVKKRYQLIEGPDLLKVKMKTAHHIVMDFRQLLSHVKKEMF